MKIQSPIRKAIIVALAIFAAEAALMLLLSRLPPLAIWAQVILDAALLAALLLPVIFFFVFRPRHTQLVERMRAEESLRRRDAILQAVTFAADRFLQTVWEQSVGEMLARLGQAAGASRVYIFENHTTGDGALLTSQRYEWAAPGIAPQIDNPQLQNFPLRDGGFVRWIEMLGGGRHLWPRAGVSPK